MARRPNLVAVDKAELRLEMLRCKALRFHAWDALPTTTGGTAVALNLRCTSCGTTRSDILDRNTGELLHRHYDYPDEYRDVDRESPVAMRLAFARRMEVNVGTADGRRGGRRGNSG